MANRVAGHDQHEGRVRNEGALSPSPGEGVRDGHKSEDVCCIVVVVVFCSAGKDQELPDIETVAQTCTCTQAGRHTPDECARQKLPVHSPR